MRLLIRKLSSFVNTSDVTMRNFVTKDGSIKDKPGRRIM